MPGLMKKSLDAPDETMTYPDGSRAQMLSLGESFVARSTLLAGWSWDTQVRRYGGGPSCPMTHREYVVSGRIRYVFDDGSEAEAQPGDHLLIPPGHRGAVIGGEPCVLLDW